MPQAMATFLNEEFHTTWLDSGRNFDAEDAPNLRWMFIRDPMHKAQNDTHCRPLPSHVLCVMCGSLRLPLGYTMEFLPGAGAVGA